LYSDRDKLAAAAAEATRWFSEHLLDPRAGEPQLP